MEDAWEIAEAIKTKDDQASSLLIKQNGVGPSDHLNTQNNHFASSPLHLPHMTTLMGRGGVMRTAAKFAAAGMRGVAVASSEAADEVVAASWDMEDWEVPDGGEVDVVEATPRVVFGGVPSFQEATAATTELKHALDKICLSSNSAECDRSSGGSQVSALSPSHSEFENKSRATEAISIPSTPNRALQAFQLLSQNPEAQTVVASIASDPNIWNAIVQNPALQDFFQSHQTTGFEAEGTLDQKMGDLSYSDPGYGFIDYLIVFQNVKITVAEMVCSVSNYFQNMFGFLSAQNSSASGNTKANFMDPFTVGGTFMGLAVLVVMVIVLKRA